MSGLKTIYWVVGPGGAKAAGPFLSEVKAMAWGERSLRKIFRHSWDPSQELPEFTIQKSYVLDGVYTDRGVFIPADKNGELAIRADTAATNTFTSLDDAVRKIEDINLYDSHNF